MKFTFKQFSQKPNTCLQRFYNGVLDAGLDDVKN